MATLKPSLLYIRPIRDSTRSSVPPWPAPWTQISHGRGPSLCRQRCTTALAGPPSPSASSVLGSSGSCSNVIRSYASPAIRRCSVAVARKGLGSACARSMPSVDNSSAAGSHSVSGRIAGGAPPSSEKPVRASSSSMTSPNWRTPRADAGVQPVDLLRPATVRGSTIPSSRAISKPRDASDNPVMPLTLDQPPAPIKPA